MKNLMIGLITTFTVQITAQISNNELDKIIDQLTLEEKVYLVVGTGINIPGFAEKIEAPQAIVGSTQDKIPGAAGTSYTNKKLGFPAVVFADGPAGIRIDPIRKEFPDKTFYATAFPTATSLASTWNVDIVKEIGKSFGREGREYGIDFLLAPALNIHRNPLGGRNFEYYSEDPVLAGKLTANFVNGVQSEGIGATIKHFVANNSETNRTDLNTVVSERALREIYLKGFQIALQESKPWAVMSSYNKINGIYASENEELLTKILRHEWHYEGFVMTDWFAGRDAVAQMRAGNNLLMPGTNEQSKSILEAVKSGKLDINILNRNVREILRQYYKTPSFRNIVPTGKPDLEASKQIARKAASEGIVLLKNEGALPLNSETKIAVFGVTSFETISGGTGSGDVNKAYMVSVVDGLNNAGYKLDDDVNAAYIDYIEEEHTKIPPKKFPFEKDILVPEKVWPKSELESIASKNDVAIFTLGRTSGEFQDRVVEADFNLTEEELTTIKNISEVFRSKNKKLVIVLNIGGVIETKSWKQYADGIILTWQLGQEAGNAVSDILSGKVNPSGKLPVTFPISLNDVASSKNFPGKVIDPTAPKPSNPLFGVPSEEIYEEGIYIGYRYFDTFDIATSFPFGYGLSYTKFEYSDMVLSTDGDNINIECTIKNSGEIDGKEVVQLYVKSANGSIEKPNKELKGFAKTKLLKPGESEKVTIRISVNDLGYYDTKSHSWKLDEGTYQFIISSNSKEALLGKSLILQSKTIQKTDKLLSPKIKINELSNR